MCCSPLSIRSNSCDYLIAARDLKQFDHCAPCAVVFLPKSQSCAHACTKDAGVFLYDVDRAVRGAQNGFKTQRTPFSKNAFAGRGWWRLNAQVFVTNAQFKLSFCACHFRRNFPNWYPFRIALDTLRDRIV